MEGFLHISYLPKSNWIYPILNKLHSTTCAPLKEKVNKWGESEISELGIALTTKFTMLPYVSDRLNKHLSDLAHQITDMNLVNEHITNNSAYTIKNTDLPYELLIDLDAFIFETRSSYELMGKFIKEFFKYVLNKNIKEKDLHDALTDSGMDLRWTETLRDGRIHFFHNAAPWFAVEVHQTKPVFNFSIVLLKKNLIDIKSNKEHYINFNELREINLSFQESNIALRDWMLKQVNEVEKHCRT